MYYAGRESSFYYVIKLFSWFENIFSRLGYIFSKLDNLFSRLENNFIRRIKLFYTEGKMIFISYNLKNFWMESTATPLRLA